MRTLVKYASAIYVYIFIPWVFIKTWTWNSVGVYWFVVIIGITYPIVYLICKSVNSNRGEDE